MIPRYEVKEISSIWSEENRFKQLLKVEIALLRALEATHKIPPGTAEVFSHVEIRPDRIREIEETTRHDVIAFCSSITEQVQSDKARYFHFGVTSSDILDTALSLQLKESILILNNEIKILLESLKDQIYATKNLLAIGRSHGMFAEPMIFGQKFLSFHQELSRRHSDYLKITQEELTGQISGAVGNYTVVDIEIEQLTLKELGLNREKVSTQVIPRDHLVKIISAGAMLATCLERIAVELRLLHHSDVNELHEGFRKGQKGSSTMPHKKNPISSENITGLARIVRSHLEVSLQNCVLWHERDISHSSTERLYLPDHFGLLVYAVRRMSQTIKNLEIHREAIEAKATNNYTALSSYILHQMILLNSVPREELYAFVQEAMFSSDLSFDFLQWIEDKAKVKGYKIPKLLHTQDLKDHYVQRFEKILEQCGL